MESEETSPPKPKSSPPPLRCPHLGLFGDPQTLIANADPRNYCHLVYPPKSIMLSHQEAFCLKQTHDQCEVYSGEGFGYFPEALFEDPGSRKRAASRVKPVQSPANSGMGVKEGIVVASAAAVMTPLPVPEPEQDLNQENWRSPPKYLENEFIGVQRRVDRNAADKSRRTLLIALSLLLVGLVISLLGIYSWNSRIQTQIRFERATANAIATSAYDSSVLAGNLQVESSSQAATLTALVSDIGARATHQAATVVALAAIVSPTPMFCQDETAIKYQIISGPVLTPPQGTTLSTAVPNKLQATWQIKNTGTCNWNSLLLWSFGGGKIILPIIQQGKVLLDPLILGKQTGIAPGNVIDVTVEYDPAQTQDVDEEFILMVNDLSLLNQPRLLIKVSKWVALIGFASPTPTGLILTSTAVPLPTSPSSPPNTPQPTSVPPTQPPPTQPPYPTRPPVTPSP